MTNYHYTHEFNDLDSSLVENVWYDEQTQTAYLDLNDSIYKYTNVPFDEVEALVQAPSIGRAFSGQFLSKGFKQKFGPSEFVGSFYDFEDNLSKREPVASAPSTFYATPGAPVTTAPGIVPKNLTYAPGANTTTTAGQNFYVNLHTADPEAAAEKVVSEIYKRVPLKTDVAATNAALEAQKPKGTYTVHFESDYSGSKTYTVESTSVDAAVAELNDVTSRLGLRVKVTGVFVHLG